MRHKQFVNTLIVSIITIFYGYAYADEVPIVEQGIIDLREWDFNTNKNLKLNGDWEFYWETFLYDSIEFVDTASLKSFIHVPDLWNSHPIVKVYGSARGFASYRAKILINTKEPLALKYLKSATSCEIFIDGVSYYKAGNPGKSKVQTIPSYKTQIISFIPQDTIVEIVLQIANFHHKKGGQWVPIWIGKEASVVKQHDAQLFLELVLIGCIFIMAIYHLIIFLTHPKDKPSFFFALFTLMITVRLVVTGENTIYMLGDVNWELMIRADYLSFYWLSFAFVHFINALYPDEVYKPIIHIVQVIIGLFSLSVIFLPTYLFAHGMLYFQFFSVLGALYIFYIIYKVVVNRREGAFHLLVGFSILFIALVHDILKENGVLYTPAIAPYGLGLFIVIQASLLSSRIRNALKANTLLSDNLQKQNTDYFLLNSRYKAQNEQLILAKEKAEQSDQFKSAFLANMSHEIRTPMNGILGFSELLGQDDFSNSERDEFIKIINERSQQLLGIVNDIIDITKIETGQIDVYQTDISINAMMDEIYRFYKGVINGKSVDIKLFTALDNERATIKTDGVKLRQILDNLMSNAIKFTSSGQVEFGYHLHGDKLKFYVKDTGIGLSKDEEAIIFGRFNQANGEIAKKYGGTGLGLPIAKAYVHKLGGDMWIESTKGKGSNFYFTLPFLSLN